MQCFLPALQTFLLQGMVIAGNEEATRNLVKAFFFFLNY
jgi:hypothetical protein